MSEEEDEPPKDDITIQLSPIAAQADEAEEGDSQGGDDDAEEVWTDGERRLEQVVTTILDAYKREPNKEHCLVVVFLNNLSKIKDADEEAIVDLSITLYWPDDKAKGKDIEDMDLEKLWTPDIEIYNANEMNKLYEEGKNFNIWEQHKEHGIITWWQRYKGTVSVQLDLHAFPLDKQIVEIRISSSTVCSDYLKLIDFSEPDALAPEAVNLVEWNVLPGRALSLREFYNPGEKMHYSQLCVSIPLARRSGFYMWKVGTIAVILVLMSWTVFLLPQESFQDSLQISMTLFLAAIAFNFVLMESLPKVSYNTFLDKYILMCYTYIFLSVVQQCVMYCITFDDPGTFKLINFLCLAVFGGSFIVLTIVFGIVGSHTVMRHRKDRTAPKPKKTKGKQKKT